MARTVVIRGRAPLLDLEVRGFPSHSWAGSRRGPVAHAIHLQQKRSLLGHRDSVLSQARSAFLASLLEESSACEASSLLLGPQCQEVSPPVPGEGVALMDANVPSIPFIFIWYQPAGVWAQSQGLGTDS